jgi:hypothetical protein
MVLFECAVLCDFPDDGPWEWRETTTIVPADSNEATIDGRRYRWDGQSRDGFGGPTGRRIFWRIS